MEGALPQCRRSTVPCGFTSCEIHGDSPSHKLAPRNKITMFWCDECGRTEWFHITKHFWRGKACAGEIHALTYERIEHDD